MMGLFNDEHICWSDSMRLKCTRLTLWVPQDRVQQPQHTAEYIEWDAVWTFNIVKNTHATNYLFCEERNASASF